MTVRWLCLLLASLSSFAAEARVFDYKDSSLAAYVRGTGALSLLDQDAFANSAGSGTTVTGASKYDYGAEVGMALAFGANTHLRLGAEVIQYQGVTGAGADAAGTKNYDLTASVFVFNPNAVLEYAWSTKGAMRYYVSLGAGYANVTAVNDYKMTAAGTSSLGLGDFKETMDTNVLSGTAAFGLETLFTDNVTVMADAGYRYLPVKQMKFKNDVTGFNGAVHKGDVVLNSDGSKRQLNLGGLFVGLTFRFYLNFL